jgi:hypothetical protein
MVWIVWDFAFSFSTHLSEDYLTPNHNDKYSMWLWWKYIVVFHRVYIDYDLLFIIYPIDISGVM